MYAIKLEYLQESIERLQGKQFGQLLAISDPYLSIQPMPFGERKQLVVTVQCTCGTVFEQRVSRLLAKRVNSCEKCRQPVKSHLKAVVNKIGHKEEILSLESLAKGRARASLLGGHVYLK